MRDLRVIDLHVTCHTAFKIKAYIVSAAKQHNVPAQRLEYCTIDSVFLSVLNNFAK